MKTIFIVLSLSFLSSIAAAQIPKDPVVRDTFVDVRQEPKMIDTLSKFLQYPEAAKRSGIEGRVILDVLISKTGVVEKVKVKQTTDSIFIEAAMTAIKKIRYTPALAPDNKPVAVWWSQPVQFNLH